MTIKTSIRVGGTYSGKTIVPSPADTIALIKILLEARDSSGERIEFTVSGIDEIDVAAEVAKQAEAAA